MQTIEFLLRSGDLVNEWIHLKLATRIQSEGVQVRGRKQTSNAMDLADRITHIVILLEVFQFKQFIGGKTDHHFVVVHTKGFLKLLIGDEIWIVLWSQTLQLIFEFYFGGVVTHDSRESQYGNQEDGSLF